MRMILVENRDGKTVAIMLDKVVAVVPADRFTQIWVGSGEPYVETSETRDKIIAKIREASQE